jgi:hypothetical protein
MNKATIDTARSPLWLELVVLIAASPRGDRDQVRRTRTWVFRTGRATVSDPTTDIYADRLRP